MPRPRHPKKEIESVLRSAEQKGWRVVKATGRGHSWGVLLCPLSSRDGCSKRVWSTPKNPGNHARDLHRFVESCPHPSAD